ncbi:fumarylacetoacetate hydrolase family protein [Variovorax sp. RA8]|uniref:fumarylacetoacetate hydrolase family protein n=1 Tax=Variovorax sp. (strain JCM 16519 / RA8) TaxID=662548 RepID=UPI000A55EB0D|nr:fumarylacetoacetate hydrolase family protein [Variovorax sp. RA8]
MRGDPQPLPYLDDINERANGSLDIRLEVLLQSAKHRARGLLGDRTTATNFRHQYWTVGQMLTQHTVVGCNVQSGDLMDTGTISGPTEGEAGAMVELSAGGTRTVPLPGTSEGRRFLADGDRVVLKGWCKCLARCALASGSAAEKSLRLFMTTVPLLPVIANKLDHEFNL